VRKQQFHIPEGTEMQLAAEGRLQQMVPNCGTSLLLQHQAQGQGWAGHRLPKWGNLSSSHLVKFKAARQSSRPKRPVEAELSPTWVCQTRGVILHRFYCLKVPQISPHAG